MGKPFIKMPHVPHPDTIFIRTKQYEYKMITKQPCLSEIDELNLLGKQGWLVVTCPAQNMYLLVREKIDG